MRPSSSTAEQWTFNPLVQGSNPWGATSHFPRNYNSFVFLRAGPYLHWRASDRITDRKTIPRFGNVRRTRSACQLCRSIHYAAMVTRPPLIGIGIESTHGYPVH
jgi:hypothetical protein